MTSVAQDNIINIAGFLFFWVGCPAFGAVSYVPALVLGESQQGDLSQLHQIHFALDHFLSSTGNS
jgi:hypothetical protein